MVSPRKNSSALTLIPEEQGQMIPASTKSCESLYSNTSSSKGSTSAIYRRKNPPMNGFMINGHGPGGRQPTLIPAATDVRQRVLSARRLRMKTFQNQLADAQQTIAELAHENRILRTLHKRQDSALAKYESTNAELPKLLHSHSEELRVWQAKYRNLQQQNKDLEQKLKQKESMVLSLSDQNKYYSQLNKDRNLEERQRLSEKLQMLETRLQEKDNDMKLLARRVQIEARNFRQQILFEQKRTKEVMLKLEKTRLELSGYRKLDELSDNYPAIASRRRPTLPEETKLEQDLEKILADDNKSDIGDKSTNGMNMVPEDASYTLPSHRSSHSGNTSKLEIHSTRTIRKLNIMGVGPLSTRANRHVDIGDGDAPTLSDFQRGSAKQRQQQQQQQQQQKKKQQQNKKPTQKPQEQQQMKSKQQRQRQAQQKEEPLKDLGRDEYEDDYEHEPTVLDVLNALGEEGEGDEEVAAADQDNENELDDPGDYNGGDDADVRAADNDDGEDDDEDEQEPDVVENVTYNLNTAKKSSRMKEDISNIRRQISEDYKEREAFLDTFCRQATNGVLMDEPPKKQRQSITLAHNLPSSRKNKLLAALKAIDDNKNHD